MKSKRWWPFVLEDLVSHGGDGSSKYIVDNDYLIFDDHESITVHFCK